MRDNGTEQIIQDRSSLLTLHNKYPFYLIYNYSPQKRDGNSLKYKGCIKKHPAELVSERQTREETVMLPDANNPSLPDIKKVTDTLREQVTNTCTLQCGNSCILFFKFVRKLRATFLVLLLNAPMPTNAVSR